MVTPHDEMPLLIASVADDDARDLERIAADGGERRVVLKWAPVQPGPHVLEVYTTASNVPLQLRVEPIDVAVSDAGHLLRIYPSA